MEDTEENIYKVLAIALVIYAVICVAMLIWISQGSPIDLDTYFKQRYGF